MTTTSKVAESLTVVHALTLKGHQNRALWGAGMKQDAEVVERTIYASEWETAP